MSDLSRIVKAYDVRGTVPDQMNDDVARAIGAAFVQTLRAAGENADRIVVAHDMRDSSPGLSAAFGEGARAEGSRRGRGRARLDRHALLRLRVTWICRGRCSRRATTRRSTTASSCAARGAKPIGQDTGLTEIRDRAQAILDGHSATGTRPRAAVEKRDLLAEYATHLRTLVDLSDIRPLQGGRRRRQRHGRLHGARPCSATRSCRRCRSTSCRSTSSWTDPSPTTRRTRWSRPTSWTCSRRSCANTAPTSGSPSTATRTAASSSTPTANPVSPSAITALVAISRARPSTPAVDGHPQPDHLARGAGDRRRARRGRGAQPGRPLLHQGRDGPHRRGLRRRALRALLLPRLLGCRHRHARRDARARRPRRAGPAARGAGPRVRAIRLVRRDQHHA